MTFAESLTSFYMKRCFNGDRWADAILARAETAAKNAFEDFCPRNPNRAQRSEWEKDLEASTGALAVFWYRLGRELLGPEPQAAGIVHAIMKTTCACEIYFSNEIGTGFEVVHSVGLVIGSRNRIGTNFRIYQGATIGHRTAGEAGAMIGQDVTVFAHAQVLGALRIGDGATIGASSIVLRDVNAGETIKGVR